MSRFTEAAVLFQSAKIAEEMASENEKKAARDGTSAAYQAEFASLADRLRKSSVRMLDEAMRLLSETDMDNQEAWIRSRAIQWLIKNRFPPVTILVLADAVSVGAGHELNLAQLTDALHECGYGIATRVHGNGPLNDSWVRK